MKREKLELEVGMMIKISEHPVLSIKKHGRLDGYKMKLAGSIQKIKRIAPDRNRIYIWPPTNCHYETISFVIEDISWGIGLNNSAEALPIIKSVMFDPEQLVL